MSFNKILRDKYDGSCENLHNYNYQTLLREIKDNLSERRARSCSWVRRLSIIKMSTLQIIYGFNAILVKTSAGHFLVEIDKLILKFIWKRKGS